MKAEVLAHCDEVFEKAKSLYGADLKGKTRITFDLKGRAAGQVQCKRVGVHKVYTLRFNLEIASSEEGKRELLDNTVQHEIAHLVCWECPELGGSKHNAVWSRVCERLGGNGERTHTLPVILARGYTYEYTTVTGNILRIGQKHHEAVQAGRIICSKVKGAIKPKSVPRIVGYCGKAFKNPVPFAGVVEGVGI